MKRCISFVFAILLAVVFFNVGAKAENHMHTWDGRTCTICGERKEVLQSGPWSYILWEETNQIEITDYEEKEADVVIPEQINGIPVTSIGDSAFYGCQNLTSITIPDSVTSIGDKAFYFCWKLTSITIPDSVTSIGNEVFSYCGALTDIMIPDSVTSIGNEVFSCCGALTDIMIPDSVTSIGDKAFSYCGSLTDITIPDGVTSVGINPFVSSPVEIRVSATHPFLTVIDGALFDTESKRLVSYPWGKKEAVYDIPQGTLEIGDYAFYDCGPAFYTIPDSVTSIGNYAFYDSNIISITIPEHVDSIGDYAFGNCSLFSITIPDSVVSIGNNPFVGASLKINVSINHPFFAVIDNVLFEKATRRLITYGSYEFTYDIPQGILEIGDRAFYDKINLTGVTIPDSVISIGDEAFAHCNHLPEITIPDSVTSIGEGAFAACSDLARITIPDSVTTIGAKAFSNCYALDSIFIPDSVISIGKKAFYWCEELVVVVMEHSYAERYCIENDIRFLYPDEYCRSLAEKNCSDEATEQINEKSS